MNDPVAGYVYWYYLGGVVLLAIVSASWLYCYRNKHKTE